LEEVAQFKERPSYQLPSREWTADGQYLFLSGLKKLRFPNSAIALYPINHAPTFKTEDVTMVMLSPNVIDTGFHYSPIKRPHYLDYFFYLETINNSHFKLWLSNYEGSEQHLVTDLDTPHYGVSDDGYVVYLHNNSLHLIKPSFKQPQADILASASFEPIKIDIADRYFGIFPSPQGKYVALANDAGKFYTINLTTLTVTDLSLSSDFGISGIDWNPDGETMAYKRHASFEQRELKNHKQGHIIIQKADGSQKHQVQYSTTPDGYQLNLSRPHWSADGNLIIAWAYQSGYCIADCDERLILISGDGQYVKPLLKMYQTALMDWSIDGKVAYACGNEQFVIKLCISKLVKK